MASRLDHESTARGQARLSGAAEPRIGRSIFLRRAARQPGVLVGYFLGGFFLGVVYRFVFDEPAERELANYLRSGLHGVGLGLTIWAVQTAFAARAPLGAAL